MWEEKDLYYYSNYDKYKFIEIYLAETRDIQLSFSIGLRHFALGLLWLNIEIYW